MCLERIKYMNNDINVSGTALVIILLGIVVGIIISIVIYKGKTLNERFVEKCRKHGTVTRAEAIKTRTFYKDRGDNARDGFAKFIITWQYMVNGKIYKKTTLEQSNNGRGGYEVYRTIYYEKNNPRKAQFLKAKSPVLGCLTGIIFWIIVIFLAIKIFP